MSCDNCGNKSYDPSVKNSECQQCGFKIIPSKDLEPMDLVYCGGCGCHFVSENCIHPLSMKTVVKHKVVEKKEE